MKFNLNPASLPTRRPSWQSEVLFYLFIFHGFLFVFGAQIYFFPQPVKAVITKMTQEIDRRPFSGSSRKRMTSPSLPSIIPTE